METIVKKYTTLGIMKKAINADDNGYIRFYFAPRLNKIWSDCPVDFQKKEFILVNIRHNEKECPRKVLNSIIAKLQKKVSSCKH